MEQLQKQISIYFSLKNNLNEQDFINFLKDVPRGYFMRETVRDYEYFIETYFTTTIGGMVFSIIFNHNTLMPRGYDRQEFFEQIKFLDEQYRVSKALLGIDK